MTIGAIIGARSSKICEVGYEGRPAWQEEMRARRARAQRHISVNTEHQLQAHWNAQKDLHVVVAATETLSLP